MTTLLTWWIAIGMGICLSMWMFDREAPPCSRMDWWGYPIVLVGWPLLVIWALGLGRDE